MEGKGGFLAVLVVAALAAPTGVGIACFTSCKYERYLPGGLKTGGRGVCEPGYPGEPGFATCDGGETCTTKYEERPNPNDPKDKIIVEVNECIPKCNMNGLFPSGGANVKDEAYFFVNLSDGAWYFCPAEFAAWQCGR